MKKEYWHRVIRDGRDAADSWDADHYQALREIRDKYKNHALYGDLVKTVQNEAQAIDAAYSQLYQAKQDWWKARLGGTSTAVFESSAAEARAKLKILDPKAGSLWGETSTWALDSTNMDKVALFEEAYHKYWQGLLDADEHVVRSAQERVETTGVSPASVMGRSIEKDWLPRVRDRYLTEVQTLRNSHSDRAREEAEGRIAFWRRHLPTSTQQWDKMAGANQPGMVVGPTTAEEAMLAYVFTPSGVTADQLAAAVLALSPHGAASREFAQLAQYYVDGERNGGPNAIFAMAKDAHETGWGTSAAFKDQKNTGGYMGDSGLRTFESHAISIQFGTRLLSGSLYRGSGRVTVPKIGEIYAPEGADNDPDNLNSHWGGRVSEYWASLTNAVNQGVSAGTEDSGVWKTAAGIAWPLAYSEKHKPVVTSVTGHRTDPVTGAPGTHAGVDIAAAVGTEVYAISDGEIVYAEWQRPDPALNNPEKPDDLNRYQEQLKLFEEGKLGYGKYIIVKHATGGYSYYAHLSSFDVKVGDKVKAGQLIGLSGNTGKSTGPHLHFEHRNEDWVVQDPLDLYPDDWYTIAE